MKIYLADVCMREQIIYNTKVYNNLESYWQIIRTKQIISKWRLFNEAERQED